jgi:hypothetical protein
MAQQGTARQRKGDEKASDGKQRLRRARRRIVMCSNAKATQGPVTQGSALAGRSIVLPCQAKAAFSQTGRRYAKQSKAIAKAKATSCRAEQRLRRARPSYAQATYRKAKRRSKGVALHSRAWRRKAKGIVLPSEAKQRLG